MDTANFESVLRTLLADFDARRFKLPRDIQPGRWLSDHLLHWMEHEAGPRLAAVREAAARLREELGRLEGADAEKARPAKEALDALDRALGELNVLFSVALPAPARQNPAGNAGTTAGTPGAPEGPNPELG